MCTPGDALPAALVLVVDDNPLRRALAFRFEAEGLRVASFSRGEALLSADLPEPVAVLVLDERLPGLSGSETLGALRRRGLRQPAILLSSQPTTALRLAAARERAIVVQKPLIEDALMRKVRAALGIPWPD